PSNTRTYTPSNTPTITLTPTVTGTPPTATDTGTATGTPTITPTPTATHLPCGGYGNYLIATATSTIDPGVTDAGNHGVNIMTNIALPFPVAFYGSTFSSANISANGNLQFT